MTNTEAYNKGVQDSVDHLQKQIDKVRKDLKSPKHMWHRFWNSAFFKLAEIMLNDFEKELFEVKRLQRFPDNPIEKGHE